MVFVNIIISNSALKYETPDQQYKYLFQHCVAQTNAVWDVTNLIYMTINTWDYGYTCIWHSSCLYLSDNKLGASLLRGDCDFYYIFIS